MRILTIGNSFSQDITTYAQRAAIEDLYLRNLYIPGCSLDMHVENFKNFKNHNISVNAYEYQKDGKVICMTSLDEALVKEKWEIITIQQVSHKSGVISSYYPYISELIEHINRKCPKANLRFIKTWPYERNCTHGGFINYENDTDTMFKAINKAVAVISKEFNLDIIDIAKGIYELYLKTEQIERYRLLNLYRDGFHLNDPLGRYVASLLFLYGIYGKKDINYSYKPKEMTKNQHNLILEFCNSIHML